ncbi:MAG: Bax inhibitor-1/YccA family protein [Lachnospiraceae bacterium]|nr:Bax inhibitor-1/YccA family protein [Lachnospiraceae bacterium]
MAQTMKINSMGRAKIADKKQLLMNPMTRKLASISGTSGAHVSYAGISNKCLYFMVTLCLGILMAGLSQRFGTKLEMGALNIKDIPIALSSISVATVAGAFISMAVLAIVPFFAFFARKAAAVLGTLYCFCTGFLYSTLVQLFEEYRAAIGLALLLTIAVCTVLFLLFRSGKLSVTGKIKTAVVTLVLADIAGGIVLAVCSCIPSLRFLAEFAVTNGVIAIVMSVVGVVLAVLFVLIEFDTVAKSVERKIPVENEWYCAFCLAFSVIWLFMKILQLVMTVAKKEA